jgi:hypothetical protein
MQYLLIFQALVTLYDEMAKGGAKAEADKIVAIVTPVLAAASSLAQAAPELTDGA